MPISLTKGRPCSKCGVYRTAKQVQQDKHAYCRPCLLEYQRTQREKEKEEKESKMWKWYLSLALPKDIDDAK